MIVAIDGPAGAGKSTVAGALAQALGFARLDSGAMYRCVALATLEDPAHRAAEHASGIEIELGERVLLDGRDVTVAIRSPAVSAAAGAVAADPAVRRAMVAQQRRLIAAGNWVVEGRDIGTVVAPDAAVKVFLTASEEVRAARRAHELGADAGVVLEAQRARDRGDRERAHSPLEPAADAVVLDSTTRTPEQVVTEIVTLVRRAAH